VRGDGSVDFVLDPAHTKAKAWLDEHLGRDDVPEVEL
jgi:hypothetical protein